MKIKKLENENFEIDVEFLEELLKSHYTLKALQKVSVDEIKNFDEWFEESIFNYLDELSVGKENRFEIIEDLVSYQINLIG